MRWSPDILNAMRACCTDEESWRRLQAILIGETGPHSMLVVRPDSPVPTLGGSHQERLLLLHRLSLRPHATRDALISDYLHTGAALLGCSLASVVGVERASVRRMAAVGLTPTDSSMPLEDSVAAEIIKARGPIDCIDASRHPGMRHRAEQQDLDLGPLAGAPLRIDGRIVGVIWFGAPRAAGSSGLQTMSVTERLELVELIAGHLARQLALRMARAAYRDLFELTPDLIAVLDNDGRLVSHNQAWSALLGYRADVLLARGVRSVVHPDDADATEAALREVARSGRGGFFEHRLLHADGTPRRIMWALAPSREERCLVGIGRDITERHAQEIALRAAKAQAEEAVETKALFLASMSHEIRTPLNGIIGLGSLLRATSLDDEQRDYVENLRLCGENLLDLINDVLDYSRIEAGRLDLERIDFNVRAVVEEALALVAQRAQARGLEIGADIHPSVPRRVKGDPGRFRQVLSNLLGNAVKFTEVGFVRVNVVVAEMDADGEMVLECSVEDSGPGIRPEMQDRLFEPFVQADSSTTRRHGGTGLGLAICQQLCALMGGTIRVHSTPGQGSTFSFSMCLGLGACDQDDLERGQFSGRRALCVAPEGITRRDLVALTARWGLEIRVTPDESTAMGRLEEACRQGAPVDLIFIEAGVLTEQEDVRRWAQRFREVPGHESVSLVLVSGLASRRRWRTAREAGFDGVVTHPLRHSVLFDLLSELLTPGSPTPAPILEQAASLPVVVKDARVLVVEDNPINQKVARRMLETLGVAADLAGNGKEALEALSRISYDMVFMDCQMPEMDGFEATAAIRANPGLTELPVVALTANAMEGDAERCLQAGMNDYLSKPVRPGELARALERWVQER